MTDTPTPRRTRRADRYKTDAPAPADTSVPAPAAAPAPPETSAQQYTRRRAQRYQAEDIPAPAASPAVPRPRRLPAETAPAVQRTRENPPPTMTRPRSAPQQKRRAPSAKPARPRMPLWMFVSIIAMVFVLAGLFTAKSLMEAYLVQRQEERQAAYQRVVDSHPIYYKDVIERYAVENNLKPAFVAAIILNESSFRTDAVSSVGARGLMQLMPDTAEWIAGKLDVSGYSFERMFDAESNIRFGTWYLGYLAKLFRGDPVLVAAAYHAGQGEVNSWLSDPSMSSDGVTIQLENMIDGPTKSYAGRVTQAYAIYEALFYRTPDGDAADAVSVYASGS